MVYNFLLRAKNSVRYFSKFVFSTKCGDGGLTSEEGSVRILQSNMLRNYRKRLKSLWVRLPTILPENLNSRFSEKEVEKYQRELDSEVAEFLMEDKGTVEELVGQIIPITRSILEKIEAWEHKEKGVATHKTFEQLGYSPQEFTKVIVDSLIHSANAHGIEKVPVWLFYATLRRSLRHLFYLRFELAKASTSMSVVLDEGSQRKLCRAILAAFMEHSSSRGLDISLFKEPSRNPLRTGTRRGAHHYVFLFKLNGRTVNLHNIALSSLEPRLQRPRRWSVLGSNLQGARHRWGPAFKRSKRIYRHSDHTPIRVEPYTFSQTVSQDLGQGRHNGHRVMFQANGATLKAINTIESEAIVFSTEVAFKLFHDELDPIWTGLAVSVDTSDIVSVESGQADLKEQFDALVALGVGCPGEPRELRKLVNWRYNSQLGNTSMSIEARERLVEKLGNDFEKTLQVLFLTKLLNNNPVYPQVRLDFYGLPHYVGFSSVTENGFARLISYQKRWEDLPLSEEGCHNILRYAQKLTSRRVRGFNHLKLNAKTVYRYIGYIRRSSGVCVKVHVELSRIRALLKNDLPVGIHLDGGMLNFFSRQKASLDFHDTYFRETVDNAYQILYDNSGVDGWYGELFWNNGLGREVTTRFLEKKAFRVKFRIPAVHFGGSGGAKIEIQFPSGQGALNPEKQKVFFKANFHRFLYSTVFLYSIRRLGRLGLGTILTREGFIAHPNNAAEVANSFHLSVCKSPVVVTVKLEPSYPRF